MFGQDYTMSTDPGKSGGGGEDTDGGRRLNRSCQGQELPVRPPEKRLGRTGKSRPWQERSGGVRRRQRRPLPLICLGRCSWYNLDRTQTTVARMQSFWWKVRPKLLQ